MEGEARSPGQAMGQWKWGLVSGNGLHEAVCLRKSAVETQELKRRVQIRWERDTELVSLSREGADSSEPITDMKLAPDVMAARRDIGGHMRRGREGSEWVRGM